VDRRIFSLAKKLKIPVVVDACQSLGISEKYGDYACYSFQAIKHFTTGDGGMLILRNRGEYQKAKKLRWFGIDREAKKRAGWRTLVNHPMAMEIEEAGYKYHMTDIAAAMGIVGLRHSDRILGYRKKLCEEYIKGLPDYIKICGGAYWLFALLTENVGGLIKYLRRNNIECDIVQLRNDRFKIFGGRKQDLPNMNRLESKYFYLPLHCNISLDDVRYITKTIRKWQT
jgi:dTDP-4-amino-4,6-dideoxygalactose transaminase